VHQPSNIKAGEVSLCVFISEFVQNGHNVADGRNIYGREVSNRWQVNQKEITGHDESGGVEFGTLGLSHD